ncbi:MAG: TetR/AcrR family transcriptional regulator [Labilithrix sp.]|nr:TetR/AcrR family transcriptional regulator [Labilithrix sp.]
MLPTRVARRRFEQLPPERQEEILRVAAEEFARAGFQRTSYNQLLERLQLGKSSAYYYFDDKRDLFLTALRRCYERFFAATRSAKPPSDAEGFWVFLERSAELGFEFMLEDPTAAALMMCLQREQALLGELGSTELLVAIEAHYTDLVREGQRLGTVRTDVPFDLLVALVRDTTMSFDRWFIAARARPADAPSSREAACWYTDAVQRLCRPA